MLQYLSRAEVLIAAHTELARKSSDAGQMQAAVDADSCAQGTCYHDHIAIAAMVAGSAIEKSWSARTEEECATDPDCQWTCSHLLDRLNGRPVLMNGPIEMFQ